MRLLLLTLLMACPLVAKSQFFGGSISYLYDSPSQTLWTKNHGIQIGMGMENHRMAVAPLTFSFRYNGIFNLSRRGDRLENVEFDLPDSIPNHFGYADIRFKSFKLGLEFDLGYQQWEYAILEPYTTFGARFSNNTSWVEYELYEQDPCYCGSNSPEEVTQTMSMGFTSGLGLKIHATQSVFFDVRATYYGTWGLKRNERFGAPDPETFHIDPYGTPTFNYNDHNYFSGFEFRLGLIFKLDFGSGSATGWYYSSGGGSDSDDDSSSDSDDNSSSSSSSGSSSSGCSGVSLSPKGRGD